jgi:hypothetical protein
VAGVSQAQATQGVVVYPINLNAPLINSYLEAVIVIPREDHCAACCHLRAA